MATPPTFVADYEGSSWLTTTSPKTTGAFNGAAGDVLVSMLADASDSNNENYTWTSSPTETWTENAETTGTLNADVLLQTATTILTAVRTGMTVTVTRTTGVTTDPYNHVVAHFTGSNGIGNATRLTGTGVAAPSFAFFTNFHNSAIVYVISDWAATDGTTRTHRTVNGFTPTAGNGQELVYFRDASWYTVYAAYIPDAGNAGSKTIGISAPAGGDCLIAAVEIQGIPDPVEETANSDAMRLMGKSFY